ncbi:MAG: putative toxin-antitoxin system toxin component, PIN family [Oscillospiraceae bacterium]|nr:putative toxin-antitoxin system toxin component, PIN family [Oscillospiraceae bacterium]
MRIMLDTNVLVSAFVLNSRNMLTLIDALCERCTIVLPTYVVDELKRVTRKKFSGKYKQMEKFLRELPYELVYTPEWIEEEDYPEIRDPEDLPVLASAIFEDVDILLTGDGDFAPVDIDHPEILKPAEFIAKYLG